MAGYASVVLVEPKLAHLDRAFTYSLTHPVVTGAHVRVPFRGRNRRGVVVDLLHDPDVENALPVKDLLGPGLDPSMVKLCRWLADRYLATMGEALAAALPARVASEEGLKPVAAAIPSLQPVLVAVRALRNGDALVAALTQRAHNGFVWRPSGSYAADVVALCAAVLSSGRGVLVLVPEVRARTELVTAIAGAFGDAVAWLGSDRPARERYRAWLSLRAGERRIAVGGRAAVFAPVEDLGLIVVDDESHPSYKEGRAPRFHARAVAAERARSADAAIVFIGSPPSVEARAAADRGPYALVAPARTDERAGRPPVTIVDDRTRLEPAGRSLAIARACIDAGERVVVLAHRSGEGLARIAERAERIVRARRPATLDATTPPAVQRSALSKADLIVASPVVAKDVRIDGVGALVIVGADAALVAAEFRAAEEAFAVWWRASRWAKRIVLESRSPQHPAVVALTRWDPDVLYRAEIPRRRELGYPPFASVARIDVPEERATDVAAQLDELDGLEVLGPVASDGRTVVVVRARRRATLLDTLRPVVDSWRRAGEPMRVDVDPWEVLGARWRS